MIIYILFFAADQVVPDIRPSSVSTSVQTELGLVNPLYWSGEITEAYANILCPPLAPIKVAKKRSSKATHARWLTSIDNMDKMKLDEQGKQRKSKKPKTTVNTSDTGVTESRKKQKRHCKADTEQSRVVFEVMTAEELVTAPSGTTKIRRAAAQASLSLMDALKFDYDPSDDDEDDTLCTMCGRRDPVEPSNVTDWVCCEFCEEWCHMACSLLNYGEHVYICTNCTHM